MHCDWQARKSAEMYLCRGCGIYVVGGEQLNSLCKTPTPQNTLFPLFITYGLNASRHLNKRCEPTSTQATLDDHNPIFGFNGTASDGPDEISALFRLRAFHTQPHTICYRKPIMLIGSSHPSISRLLHLPLPFQSHSHCPIPALSLLFLVPAHRCLCRGNKPQVFGLRTEITDGRYLRNWWTLCMSTVISLKACQTNKLHSGHWTAT